MSGRLGGACHPSTPLDLGHMNKGHGVLGKQGGSMSYSAAVGLPALLSAWPLGIVTSGGAGLRQAAHIRVAPGAVVGSGRGRASLFYKSS